MDGIGCGSTINILRGAVIKVVLELLLLTKIR